METDLLVLWSEEESLRQYQPESSGQADLKAHRQAFLLPLAHWVSGQFATQQ